LCFSSIRRHSESKRDWRSDVCSSDLPRTASEQSEVFNAVGDYPAIFGWDTGSIYGREKPGVEGEVEQSIENLSESMIKAHELGEIGRASCRERVQVAVWTE